jgi:hypothetical protein
MDNHALMSNELTTQNSGFLAQSDDAYAALAEAANEMGSGGGVYLKFDGNTGIYTYGSTGDQLSLGTQVAFNPMSLQRGWICWKDEEVVDEVMTGFLTGKPVDKGSLADHGPYDVKGDGWQEQSIIIFKMVEEPFAELTFKATGIGKRNAVGRLVQDFVKSYKANPGLVPIVEVDEVEYESKAKEARGARKHAPVFKIVAWVTEAQLLAIQGDDAGDYEPEPAPLALAAPVQQVAAPVAEAPAAEDDNAAYEAPAPEPTPKAAPRRPAARPAPAAQAAPAPEPVAQAPAAVQPAARRGRF